MTIQQLRHLHKTHLINLAGLCKKAGVNYDSVYQKLYKRRKLAEWEAEALGNALRRLSWQINKQVNRKQDVS